MPTGDIETYRQSIERPDEFWAEAAEAIDWERRRDRVLGDSRSPFYLWFAGGRLNTCWSPLDCTMREIADGETYPLPATIDDPAVLAEIDKALATAGYAKR